VQRSIIIGKHSKANRIVGQTGSQYSSTLAFSRYFNTLFSTHAGPFLRPLKSRMLVFYMSWSWCFYRT